MLRVSFLILLNVLAPPVSAEIRLVVSIKPLQLIAQALTGEQAHISMLVPENGSPHHYIMTPSDRLALEAADLIVYVGEALETELHEAIDGLGREAVLQLIEAPSIHKRQLAGTSQVDPHIWLDSDNGLRIAAALRDRLVQIEPGIAPLVDQNFLRLQQQLQDSRQRWQSRIDALASIPYAVYHDGIGYFEAQFNRRHSVVLVEDPEIQPGIRQLLAVRRSIESLQPACLLTDVTARQNTIDTLFAGQQFHQQQLDLLGERLAAGEGYLQLLENLVTDFTRCIAGEEHR